MAISDYKPLGGKTRRYQNIKTGETISRWAYDKLRGIDRRAEAAKAKQENLAKALARPARGRAKATTKQEIEQRVQTEIQRQELKQTTRLERLALQRSRRIKQKVIRPQLLKTGHRAARISIVDYAGYLRALEQMQTQKLRNGKRLISWYSIGIVGIDERTGREIAATLITAQSPTRKLSEAEFSDMTYDFLFTKSYFIFSHYFIHLHFNNEYAEYRMRRGRRLQQQHQAAFRI